MTDFVALVDHALAQHDRALAVLRQPRPSLIDPVDLRARDAAVDHAQQAARAVCAALRAQERLMPDPLANALVRFTAAFDEATAAALASLEALAVVLETRTS